MSATSKTIKAVSDGTEIPADAVAVPASDRGFQRVQEEQVYYLSGLAAAALYEAERLVTKVKDTALDRTVDRNGSKGTQPIDLPQTATVITEALDCIEIACESLSRLNVDIRTRQGHGLSWCNDPF